MSAFRIVGKAAVAFYEELFFYIVLGIVHLLSWLLIVPGPFVLAGIYTIGQKAVRGLGVKWPIIWDGIKQFGARSLLLFLIILLGYGLIYSNLWFYNTPDVSPFPATVAIWTTPIFVGIAVLWTCVAFYAQAFLMELVDPRMGVVLRNSLFLTIVKPFQTLFFVLISAVVLVVSVALPVLLILTPGFVTALALTAVRTLVTDLTEKQTDANEEYTKDDATSRPTVSGV
jgi:uncharacterized membrane protein YesL